MQVSINNKFYELKATQALHLQALLASLMPTLKSKGIAVALNDQVIPRSQWAETPISAGANIVIITATQGG